MARRDKLLKALETIMSECKSHYDGYLGGCQKCPLSYDRGKCYIHKSFPADWNIKHEEAPWKAFEEPQLPV